MQGGLDSMRLGGGARASKPDGLKDAEAITEGRRSGRQTAGQDGGIGRNTVPPRTTQRRTTTNLKTKNNQNCQKIELYGSSTTKELNKRHSFRLVGEAETGSWGGKDSQQGGSW